MTVTVKLIDETVEAAFIISDNTHEDTVSDYVEVTQTASGDWKEVKDSGSMTGRSWVSGPSQYPTGYICKHNGVDMIRVVS